MARKSHSTRTSFTLLPFALLIKSSRLSKNCARRSSTLLFYKKQTEPYPSRSAITLHEILPFSSDAVELAVHGSRCLLDRDECYPSADATMMQSQRAAGHAKPLHLRTGAMALSDQGERAGHTCKSLPKTVSYCLDCRENMGEVRPSPCMNTRATFAPALWRSFKAEEKNAPL